MPDQTWDPISEAQKRFPGFAKEPPEKIISYLSEPQHFKTVFPEYAKIPDSAVPGYMVKYAPKQSASDPSTISSPALKAGAALVQNPSVEKAKDFFRSPGVQVEPKNDPNNFSILKGIQSDTWKVLGGLTTPENATALALSLAGPYGKAAAGAYFGSTMTSGAYEAYQKLAQHYKESRAKGSSITDSIHPQHLQDFLLNLGGLAGLGAGEAKSGIEEAKLPSASKGEVPGPYYSGPDKAQTPAEIRPPKGMKLDKLATPLPGQNLNLDVDQPYQDTPSREQLAQSLTGDQSAAQLLPEVQERLDSENLRQQKDQAKQVAKEAAGTQFDDLSEARFNPDAGTALARQPIETRGFSPSPTSALPDMRPESTRTLPSTGEILPPANLMGEERPPLGALPYQRQLGLTPQLPDPRAQQALPGLYNTESVPSGNAPSEGPLPSQMGLRFQGDTIPQGETRTPMAASPESPTALPHTVPPPEVQPMEGPSPIPETPPAPTPSPLANWTAPPPGETSLEHGFFTSMPETVAPMQSALTEVESLQRRIKQLESGKTIKVDPESGSRVKPRELEGLSEEEKAQVQAPLVDVTKKYSGSIDILKNQLSSAKSNLRRAAEDLAKTAPKSAVQKIVSYLESRISNIRDVRRFVETNLDRKATQESALRGLLNPLNHYLTPEQEAYAEEVLGHKPKITKWDVTQSAPGQARTQARGLPEVARILHAEDRAEIHKMLGDKQVQKTRWDLAVPLDQEFENDPIEIAKRKTLRAKFTQEIDALKQTAQKQLASVPKEQQAKFYSYEDAVSQGHDVARIKSDLGLTKEDYSFFRDLHEQNTAILKRQEQLERGLDPVQKTYSTWEKNPRKLSTETWSQAIGQKNVNYLPTPEELAAYHRELGQHIEFGVKMARLFKKFGGIKESTISEDFPKTRADWAKFHEDPRPRANLDLKALPAASKDIEVPTNATELPPEPKRTRKARAAAKSYTPEETAEELRKTYGVSKAYVNTMGEFYNWDRNKLIRDFEQKQKMGVLPKEGENEVYNIVKRLVKGDPENPSFLRQLPYHVRSILLALPEKIQDKLFMSLPKAQRLIESQIDPKLHDAVQTLTGRNIEPDFLKDLPQAWGRTSTATGQIHVRAKGLIERSLDWATQHKEPYSSYTMNSTAAHELGHVVGERVQKGWLDSNATAFEFLTKLRHEYPEAMTDMERRAPWLQRMPVMHASESFANAFAHWYEGGGPKDGGIISKLISQDPELSNAVGHLRDAAKDFKGGSSTPLGKLSLTEKVSKLFDKDTDTLSPSGRRKPPTDTPTLLNNLKKYTTNLPRDPSVQLLSDEDTAPKQAWISPDGSHAVGNNGNIHEAVARVMLYGENSRSTMAHLDAMRELQDESWIRKRGEREYSVGKITDTNLSTIERDLMNEESKEGGFHPRDFIYLDAPWSELKKNGLSNRIRVEDWKKNDFKLSGTASSPNDVTAYNPSGFKKGSNALEDAWKSLVDFRTRMKEGDKISSSFKQTIREYDARRELKVEKVVSLLDPIRNAFSTLSKDESKEIMTNIDRGLPQSSRNGQAFAEQWDALNTNLRKAVQSLGTGKLEHVLQHYFPHMWDDPKRAGEIYQAIVSGRRQMEGTKQFLRDREILHFDEGIDKYGLTPRSWNPVDNVIFKANEMYKYVAAHEMLRELGSKGLVRWIEEGKLPRGTDGKPMSGWSKLNDQIFKKYEVDTEGNTVGMKGSYWAPNDGVSVINKYLSPGLERYGVYRGIRWFGNAVNMAQLGVSGFHLTMSGITDIASQAALGVRQIARGDFSEGIPRLAKAATLTSPISNLREGADFANELRSGVSNPDTEALQMAGGAVRQNAMYANDSWRKLQGAMAQHDWAGIGLHAAPALLEKTGNFVMSNVVPNLKLANFKHMAEDIRSRLPNATPEELRSEYQKAWDSIDNRFGQFRYNNLFVDRAVKDIAHIAVRSLGWDLGSIREAGGAVMDSAGVLRDTLKGEGFKPTDRMYFVATYAATLAYVGAMYQYLSTGKKPESWQDYFFPQTGRMNSQGRPERVAYPSYTKDFINFYHDPEGTITNKLSPVLQNLHDIWTNKDFYNTEIRHKEDNPWDQMKEVASYEAKQFIPISARTTEQRFEAGQGAGAAVKSWFGFNPAPRYLGETPAEQHAEELSLRQTEVGPKTQQERSAQIAKSALRNGFNSGRLTDKDLYAQFKAGKISSNDFKQIYENKNTPILERETKQLREPSAAMEVWQKATPEEKKRLQVILVDKLHSALKSKPTEDDPQLMSWLKEVYYFGRKQ